MTNKPKWVEALEQSEEMLKKASEDNVPEDRRDTFVRISNAWLNIAIQYKNAEAA